jgi:hypothetical protein
VRETPWTRAALLLFVPVALILGPSTAGAQPASTGGTSVTFASGEQGRSGCLVCHSNKNLKKRSAGRILSFYIDEAMIARSAHSKINCVGCHVDFRLMSRAAKPNADFRRVAGLACRGCHAKQWGLYQTGVHGKARSDGKNPICSDCHGSHDIGWISKDTAARARLHRSAFEVCGRCHSRYWSNYNDYYHGAAYKGGAADAPACWQCHRAHDVFPTKSKASATNPANLAVGCSSCHPGVRDDFLEYSRMVHGSDLVRRANALERFFMGVADALRAQLGSKFSAMSSAVAAL